MKLKATIISLISVFIVGLTAILLYCFWPAIKGTVDDSKYYTAVDLQESYDSGFEDGCKTETELLGQVQYYKGLVDEYHIEVNTLNNEITLLNNSNLDYSNRIDSLELQKSNLEEQVENLTEIKLNNETTISNLNSQIRSLENEKVTLENTLLNKEEIISQKDIQISNLQATVKQLQKTNELNVETISNLNNQIVNLNSQISDLTLQVQNNSNNVIALNNKISELEKSISYYEQYIANLETSEQVVATFEFNGSVYNIQIVDTGSFVSVVEPTSTEYVVFNYWTVDGVEVDLSTYAVSTNTRFVANVTYYYDVNFMVNNELYDSQLVIKNGYATIPESPSINGFEFDGWSTNGVDIVNINTSSVISNVTYHAVLTQLHTVDFVYEDTVIDTQTIRNGEFAEVVNVENSDYKVFNGWSYNNSIIDLTNYKITSSMTLIADLTYYYDVNFMVNNELYDSQLVIKNGYATVPEEPSINGYVFDGWTINGEFIDLSTYQVTYNVTITAVFHQYIFAVNSSETTFYLNDPILNAQIDSGELASHNINFYVSATFKNEPFSAIASGSLTFYRSGDDLNYSASITIRNSEGSFTAFFEVNYSSETGFEFSISSSGRIKYGILGNLEFNLSSISVRVTTK